MQYSRRQILKSGLVAGVACASLPAWSEINGINEAINKAGRQRMLSQRMAKYYQAMAWGVGDANSSAGLGKARREFADAQTELLASPVNTPQLKDALGLVGQQWFFFENALGQKSGADNRPQTAVATTSERILEEMESVVTLYERLPH